MLVGVERVGQGEAVASGKHHKSDALVVGIPDTKLLECFCPVLASTWAYFDILMMCLLGTSMVVEIIDL